MKHVTSAPNTVKDVGRCSEEKSNKASSTTLSSQPSTSHADVKSSPSPPNGGLRAWLVVLGVFFMFVETWGISSSYGAWQQFYQDVLLPDQAPSNLAWIGSIQSFLLVITGLVAGPLFDMGYFRILLVVGHLLMVFSLMMTSLCTQYYQLILAQGVAFGIGSGLIYIPGLALVTTLFTTKKPFAIGLLSTGTSIGMSSVDLCFMGCLDGAFILTGTGGAVFPIVFRRLRPQIGFPWTTRIIAFVVLGCALVTIALLYPEAARRPARPPRKFFDFSAYKNPAFSFFSLALFFQFIAFWVPFFYIPAFSLDALGTSRDWAYYMLAITNAAGVISRPLAGFVGHKFGPANVDMVCVIAAAATLFGWLGVTSFGGFVGFAIVWGLFSGVLVSFPAAIVTHPALSPNMDIAGTRLGMSWAAAALGILVGTPVAGVLVDDKDGLKGFRHMEEFSGAIMVVGAILLVVPLIACWRRRHD